MQAPLNLAIDKAEQGDEHYLKVNEFGHYHNSDGLGEGIVSLLLICVALFDSEKEKIIVIDEPELSLHPTIQRRLVHLLADYAADRQIVYATHSPYFVDFEHILKGAEIARVHKNDGASTISQLTGATVCRLSGFLKDINNPHVLGVEAREALFQDDGVVVVEGQDDVVLYPCVLDQLVKKAKFPEEMARQLKERFFGWGAGGADKIKIIVSLLRDLGFERVTGLVDKNKASRVSELESEFPNYFFYSILAEDIRTKTEPSVCGLLDEQYELRSKFMAHTKDLFEKVG